MAHIYVCPKDNVVKNQMIAMNHSRLISKTKVTISLEKKRKHMHNIAHKNNTKKTKLQASLTHLKFRGIMQIISRTTLKIIHKCVQNKTLQSIVIKYR